MAHTVRIDGKALAKGTSLTAQAAAALAEAGYSEIPVAILEPGDVGENEAAALVARALAVPGLSCTRAVAGRCSLVADEDGLATVAAAPLRALNLICEDITIATVPAEHTVRAGDAVASVKVIPFAVARATVQACIDQARQAPPLRLAPFRRKRARMIVTVQQGRPGGPIEALRTRLAAHAVDLTEVHSCAHDTTSVAECLKRVLAEDSDLVLLLGASATLDRRDLIPTAITAVGGVIERVGMPADPGNLLVFGRYGAVPVIVVPGCARAAKSNGFDLVLRRIVADLPVGIGEIADLALGGLLTGRPQSA